MASLLDKHTPERPGATVPLTWFDRTSANENNGQSPAC